MKKTRNNFPTTNNYQQMENIPKSSDNIDCLICGGRRVVNKTFRGKTIKNSICTTYSNCSRGGIKVFLSKNIKKTTSNNNNHQYIGDTEKSRGFGWYSFCLAYVSNSRSLSTALLIDYSLLWATEVWGRKKSTFWSKCWKRYFSLCHKVKCIVNFFRRRNYFIVFSWRCFDSVPQIPWRKRAHSTWLYLEYH